MNKAQKKISNDPSLQFQLEPNDPERLARLCGQFNDHIKQIEQRLSVVVNHRDNTFNLIGLQPNIDAGQRILQSLYDDAGENELMPEDVHLCIQDCFPHSAHSDSKHSEAKSDKDETNSIITVKTPNIVIKPRGKNQIAYIKNVQYNDINFGIGPAGTGKTFLAVACAVNALIEEKVERILLVRPAVEAGEKLGFLPGDLSQKIDPYLRPLYDALYETLGFDRVTKLLDKNVIEIAPLAFMRGRTLNHSFIILDESQNTTKEQMKMFLTRIGFGSTAVITGDQTQIDLPKGMLSGLTHAIKVLQGVDGIGMTHFIAKDVVRHPLVQRIVEAYEKNDGQKKDFDREGS